MTGAVENGAIKVATVWTTLEFVLGSLLGVFFIAVLARLLTPEDFGTFALLAIFLGIATALIEGGFGLALIQNQDTTDDDNATVFWISLASAAVFAGALAAAAPLISGFFEIPALKPLVLITSVTVLISGLGIVHRALLVKRLAFRVLTLINITALVVSGVLAIALAWFGYGVQTLAWQGLAFAFATSTLLWINGRWTPAFVFHLSSARRLFGFGGYMFASTLLEVSYSKAYTLLIGNFYGPPELGQFSRAESASQMVTGLVAVPISKVAFPAFSQMRGDPDRLRNGLQRAVPMSMLFNAAAMLTLAVVARPFVLTVFGPQWEQAAQILPLLALGALLMPLHVLNLQVLMALGRADLFLVLEIIKKVLGVAILIFSVRYGVFGIAWGLIAGGLISFFINVWYSGIMLDYGPIKQMVQIIPSLAVGIMSASAAYVAMGVITVQTPILLLFAGLCASATALIGIVGIMWYFGYDLTGFLPDARRKRKTLGRNL